MEEEQEFKTTINDIISSLEEIGKTAIRQKFQEAALDCIFTLRDIGIEAVNQGFVTVIKNVIFSLRDVCKEAITSEFEIVVDSTVLSIQRIALSFIDKEFTYGPSSEFIETKNCIITSMVYTYQSFEIIIKTSFLQDFKPALQITSKSLLNISLYAIKKDRSWLIDPLIVLYGNIGREIAGKEFEGSVDISVSPLMEIGLEILKRELTNEAKLKDISLEHVTNSLLDVAKVAIINKKKSDTDLVIRKLENLTRFMFESIRENISNPQKSETLDIFYENYLLRNVVCLSSSFRSIGVMCSQNGLIGSVNHAILLLRQLGNQLLNWRVKIENLYYDFDAMLIYIIFCIGQIGATAAEEKFEIALVDASEALAKIGEEAISQKFEKISREAISSLEHIGTRIFKLKEIDSLSNCVFSNIEIIVYKLIDQKMESLIVEVILYLKKISKNFIVNDMEKEICKVINLLEIIGQKASSNKLQSVTITSINTLHEIGLMSIKESITIQKILSSLFIISKNTISEELIETTNETVHALNDIGKVALREKQIEIAIKAEHYLNDVYSIFEESSYNIPEKKLIFKFSIVSYIKELKEGIEKSLY